MIHVTELKKLEQELRRKKKTLMKDIFQAKAIIYQKKQKK